MKITHLAGGAASVSDGSRAYYMDVILARTAYILTNAPDYPGGYDPDRPWWEITAATTTAAGVYWDTQLRDYGTPQEYR